MRRMFKAFLALPLLGAGPSGTTITVRNPTAIAEPDALVTLPAALVPKGSGAWSIQVGDKALPAQRLADGRLIFTMPLAAHGVRRVRLMPHATTAAPRVDAVLNVRIGGAKRGDAFTGGHYRRLDRFAVPTSHSIHDNLIAFEGPGWESDRVAYRLYLDERGVTDIFGKKLPAPILGKIGIGGDNYHDMADWGQDIFQVDQSLGMGGLGVEKAGRAVQIGSSALTAEVIEKGPVRAGIRVTAHGAYMPAGAADLSATYRIAAGSRLTMVEAHASRADAPIVAGLTHHQGMKVIEGHAPGGWHYIATWGAQSLARDDLGIALFFPPEDATGPIDDGQTLFVRFRDSCAIRYAFAAAWAQERGGIRGEAAFRLWLDEAAQTLAHPATVTAR